MSQDLLQRVERLERHKKILFVLLLICCVVVGITLFRRSSNSIPETLAARSIEVVGDSGSNAVSLSATSDGWVMLSFQDLKGEQKATLMMTPSGKPSLTFFNNQHARLNLGVVDGSNNEEFSIQLMDTNGKVIWQPDVPNSY